MTTRGKENMKTVSVIALALGLLVGWAAHADETRGWYGSINAGIAASNNYSRSANGLTTGEFVFDRGFAVDGTIGYDFNPFRVEGELSWRQFGLDNVGFSQGSGDYAVLNGLSFPIEGHMSSLGFMVNGWYDIDTGSQWTPFVGGGIGRARVKGEASSFTADGISYPFNLSGSEWVFAYQIGAGVAYQITEKASLQVGYRYFTTDKFSFSGHKPEIHNVTA